MRRFTSGRGRWFLLGAVVGAFLAAGAVTLAAIPDSSGVIHGCYQKNSGQLRLIDTEPNRPMRAARHDDDYDRHRGDDDYDGHHGDDRGGCRRSEIAISWNQTGPPARQVRRDRRATPAPPGRQDPLRAGRPAGTAGRNRRARTGRTRWAAGRNRRHRAGRTRWAAGRNRRTGPAGPAGPQGPAGPSLAGQSCPSGQFVTGVSQSGNIICSSGCPSGALTFHITSVVVATLHNWPGGTQTQNSGANCSVTVRAPSGNISLPGDAWEIVSTTGWSSATGSVRQPICRSPAAAPSVTNGRPICSNSSDIFASGPSEDDFVVTVG